MQEESEIQPAPSYLKRRVVRVSLSCDAVDSFLRARDERVWIDGLHPQSVLIGIAFDPATLSVNFFYSHESYPEVDAAVYPPTLFPSFARGESMHWISVDAQLPPLQKNVLAHYINSLGNYRIVRSFYVPAFCVEADDDCDEDFYDWVESESRAYIKQGWYENCEASCGFYPIEETPTHWMNLPKPPPPPTAPVIEYR